MCLPNVTCGCIFSRGSYNYTAVNYEQELCIKYVQQIYEAPVRTKTI